MERPVQFIIRGTFNDKYNRMSSEKQKESIESEWAKSREYYAKGLLRFIWLFDDQPVIMSIFEADSREHMDALLADYPGVKQGFVTAEIHKVGPYGGFMPEFAQQ